MGPKLVDAALTSPMGSEDADMAWLENDGMITATRPSQPNPYAYVPAMKSLRSWDTVPVPAKRSGRTMYKRVKHAYPVSRPCHVPSADAPRVKRACLTPPILRSSLEPVFVQTGVENAGFWDLISAKVHTRNALYTDSVLPRTGNALPSRQKRALDAAKHTPSSAAVTADMLATLQVMAEESTTLMRLSDVADALCKALERVARPRKLQLADITDLSTIEELPEPESPGPIRPSYSRAKSGKLRWSPIRRPTKFTKHSPSPERKRANEADDMALPSTPSRQLFASSIHTSPSKGTPSVPAETLRVFCGDAELSTPTTGEVQRQESSHLQRSRARTPARLSLASQAKISAIGDENAVAASAQPLDSPMASMTHGKKKAAVEDLVQFFAEADKAPAINGEEEATPADTAAEAPKALAADDEEKVTAVGSVQPLASQTKALVANGSEKVAVEVDLAPDTPVAEKDTGDLVLSDLAAKHPCVDLELEDSILEQTEVHDMRGIGVDFERKIERRLSEPNRATSTPEVSVDARKTLDIFNRPVTSVRSLAKAAAEVKTAISEANVVVERHEGRLVVRFKLPEAYVNVFSTHSTPSLETAEEDHVQLDTAPSGDKSDLTQCPIPSGDSRDSTLSTAPPGDECTLSYPENPLGNERTPTLPTLPSGDERIPSHPATPSGDERAPTLRAIRSGDEPTPTLPTTLSDSESDPTLRAAQPEVTADQPGGLEEYSVVGIDTDVLFGGFPRAPRVPTAALDAAAGRRPRTNVSSLFDSYFTASEGGVDTDKPRIEADSSDGATKGNTQSLIDQQSTPKAATEDPHAQSTPPSIESLLQSPFVPSCAGTPKRATLATSPSRALEHNVPCERRETPDEAPLARSPDLAEAQEAADRAYLGNFVSQHKASKAARSATQGSVLFSSVNSTGSPSPRTPLGQVDANTASPTKEGVKRKAGDDEEAEEPSLPSKRSRKGSALKAKATDDAPLRRSSRVKAKEQEPEAGSKIPVRVGSGVFGGPAAGGETREADLASVTRANTRRNKGKAMFPAEVLARQKVDPAARRMQELKEVHDARAARAGKAAKKGVQWGENSEVVFEVEDEEEEVEKAKEAPKKGKGAAKKGKGTPKKEKDAPKKEKDAPKKEKGAPKKEKEAPLKENEAPKKAGGRPKKAVVARPATPAKRQTRSSARLMSRQ